MKELMQFQAFTGKVFSDRAEAINDECKYLRSKIELIAALEQGAGGNMSRRTAGKRQSRSRKKRST